MNYTNIEQARFNMIEQQIRPAEVLDTKVLEVIANTHREDFVPKDYESLAFSDTNIPLANGQEMLKPILEARILQALSIQKTDKVLEIGTGSGYFTALLAKLAKEVISIEIVPELSQSAEAKLVEHNLTDNVTIVVGDAAEGWAERAAYDVIAVTGSMPILSESLKTQLTIGGRLLAIVGTGPAMSVLLITRIGEDQWNEEALFETVAPPLTNTQQPQQFVF